jgi:hypothetical protein
LRSRFLTSDESDLDLDRLKGLFLFSLEEDL